MLNYQQMATCAHYESVSPISISTDRSLTISTDLIEDYMDHEFDGFGESFTGTCQFTVQGQPSITVNIVNNTISLATLFPALYNPASRGVSRTAAYSREACDLMFLCWGILLRSNNSINTEQMTHFHDIVSNHSGLQCSHVGDTQAIGTCESCDARFVIYILCFPN